MNGDNKLDALLRQGRVIEPRAGFEQAVWSRINTTGRERKIWWSGWVVPVAVAAGLLIGLGLAVRFPATSTNSAAPGMLVRNGSLTGSYLALVGGGAHE